MSKINLTPSFLSEKEVSSITSVKPATLRVWRKRGQGPRWVKLNPARNGTVRYPRDEFVAWWQDKMNGIGEQYEQNQNPETDQNCP